MSATLALACSSDTLPEAYGIYSRASGQLTTLKAAPPGPTDLKIEDESNFIFFDNRIAPGQDLSKQLGIVRAIWINRNVDQVIPRENAKPTQLKESPLDSWQEINSGFIPSDTVPVEGKPNMLIVRPKQPLKAGVYYAFFFGSTYPFVVGDEPVKAAQQAECFDAWRTALDKNAPFSWGNWFTMANNMQASTTSDGHKILKTEYKRCSDYDQFAPQFHREQKEQHARQAQQEEAAKARADAEEAHRRQRLAEAKQVTKTLGTFTIYDTDVFGKLKEPRTVSVTDVSIMGMTPTEATGDEGDSAWLCYFSDYGAESLGTVLGSERARIYLRYEIDLKFNSSEERDRFVTTVNEAGRSWWSRFADVGTNSHQCTD